MSKRYVRFSSIAFKMKGIILTLLISVLFLSFTACGAGNINNNTAPITGKDSELRESDNSNTSLILATTTSVNDSGLMKYLQPFFEKDTGISLKVVSQGTGQAVKTAENGDADVLLIHDKKSEEKFVSDGHGLERIELMYNYFVVVGPKDNPAGILKSSEEKQNAAKAFKKIMDSKSTFISRGDDSGTHKKELSLWQSQNIKPAGQWYVQAGRGMGDVLLMASEKKAYTLTDKATYLSMEDKLDLQVVVDGAKDLLNQYTIIQVNAAKHSKINKNGAGKFMQWITSEKALKMISDYGKDKYGESLFTVNYSKK